jgi:4-hydroxy-2-oxoheptanedioate aldolase
MQKDSRIKEGLKNKDVVFGTWAQMNSPEFCEIAARSGMDFVIVDMEHGAFGIDSAVNMIRAVEAGGAAPIVRVPDASRSGILKALDAGAAGILVPNVDNKTMVEEIVAATKFAPTGTRGACPCTRATAHGVEEWGSYVDWCERNLVVGALVETPEGLRNFEEIISVPGLDIIALGPFDLSQALGRNGDWKHPEVRQKQEELVRLARAKGLDILAATFDSDPVSLKQQVDGWRELGVRMFAVSGDRFMLSSGYKSIVSSLRG